MKSLMKWAFELFVVTMIVLLGFNHFTNLKVSATDDSGIYMQAETLTAETIFLISSSTIRNQLQAGDVQVSFCIMNNPGFCNSGMGFYYDCVNFEPITNPANNKPLGMKGIAGQDLTVIVSMRNDIPLIGIATNGGDLSVDDGIIYSVFLRPKTNNPPTNPVTDFSVNMLSTDQDNHFYPEEDQYVHILDRYYICGDLDDNGVINADDSNIITDIAEV